MAAQFTVFITHLPLIDIEGVLEKKDRKVIVHRADCVIRRVWHCCTSESLNFESNNSTGPSLGWSTPCPMSLMWTSREGLTTGWAFSRSYRRRERKECQEKSKRLIQQDQDDGTWHMPHKHAGKHTNGTQADTEGERAPFRGNNTVSKQGVMYATSALATYLLQNKPVYF